MAEQISRRSNNVTSSGFDLPFENQLIRFGQGGLNLKDSLDAMEGWSRLTNIWTENEGEATARPGETILATHPAASTCHSIRKLRDPETPANTSRLWGVGTELHRGPTTPLGATTSIATGFSGDPLALLPHRPTLSGDTWMFVGDRLKMVKVRSDGHVSEIGLPKPGVVSSSLGQEYRVDIALLESADGSQAASWTGAPGKDEKGNTMSTPITLDTGAAPTGGSGGVLFQTAGDLAHGTYDSWWGMARTRNLNTLVAWPGGSATVPATDDDLIHFWTLMTHPHLIQEIRLYFVCSSSFDPLALPGTNNTSNGDAYVKAFRRDDFTQFIQGKQSQIDAAETSRVHNLRDRDLDERAIVDARTTWDVLKAVKDPARRASLMANSGSFQWLEFGNTGVPLRRGDFQRIGVTTGRDWGTITGLIVYVRTEIDAVDHTVAVALDDLYITGGHGPDTAEPGLQMYDYRATNYDSRTGAESNGSPEQAKSAHLDTLRREIVITPPAYGDSAIRQRIYRRGGSLYDDWYYLGENGSNGGSYTDKFADVDIVAAGTMPTDHFQPVPTINDAGDPVYAQPVPALWGPVEGMLFACGDKHQSGHVFFSTPGQPDHWSAAGNVEVCAPSEELQNGGVAGHQAFVFSRSRLYMLYPNLTGPGGVTATPSLCTRGLLSRWGMTIGPGGLVFFVAEDGIFVTQGGPEDWVSQEINPLFYGTAVNGYQPIDKTAVTAIRLTCWENDLFFQYQDTSGVRQVMVYSILQKFWRHYLFGKAPATLQGEDEDVLLIGGNGTGASYSHTGYSDDGVAIAATIRTGAFSGGRREEKLFGDSFLDVEPTAETSVQFFLNEETHANTVRTIFASSGRQRVILDAFGTSPQKAHSLSCEVRWSSTTTPVTLYQLGYAITLQPDLTNRRVTNWDDLNSPDEVWLTGVTLDCDTGGSDKIILVERDFNGVRDIVDTLTVNCDNRHKRKFSWPAVPANMVRLRPDGDCEFWLLYRADWIYVQEPPRISKWDIHFENAWDQYYTGLDLYCDTFGMEKRIEIWVDEVPLVNDLAGGLSYWPITADGRRVVHLTLPWGRGHVFRFFATDDNPGLLYTHRWHLQEEPSEQANWNQNFSVLGTRADKWLKAVIFECDTFNQPKSVQIEVDGAVVETITVSANGRRVIQTALSQQRLGRVWRMFPVDGNPGRLYSAEPIFDEEPFCFKRWETQETNHALPGWFYPLYAHITLKSSADVTLTTVMQHNQVGGTTTRTYTIPLTGGVKQRRFLPGFQAGKGVLIKYILTSSVPFWLYRDETTVVIQPWGAYESITVQPFGNDDLDPSRPMTHAILAAQSSGGAVAPGQANQ